jgi:hypothetical protein
MNPQIGDIIIIISPRGRGDFYYLVSDIKESEDRAYLIFLNPPPTHIHNDRLCYSLDSVKKGWRNWKLDIQK